MTGYNVTITEHNVLYPEGMPAQLKNPAFYKALRSAVKVANLYAPNRSQQVAKITTDAGGGVVYLEYKSGQKVQGYNREFAPDDLQFLVHLLIAKSWLLLTPQYKETLECQPTLL